MDTFQEQIRLHPGLLKIIQTILKENKLLKIILRTSDHYDEVKLQMRQWMLKYFEEHKEAYDYYKNPNYDKYLKLKWRNYAAIRLMDYLDHDGMVVEDPNHANALTVSAPIRQLWLAVRYGKGNGNNGLFWDLLFLFRQLNKKLERQIPDREKITNWMKRHPSGLDPKIIKRRKEAKERIILKIIENIDKGIQKTTGFGL